MIAAKNETAETTGTNGTAGTVRLYGLGCLGGPARPVKRFCSSACPGKWRSYETQIPNGGDGSRLTSPSSPPFTIMPYTSSPKSLF